MFKWLLGKREEITKKQIEEASYDSFKRSMREIDSLRCDLGAKLTFISAELNKIKASLPEPKRSYKRREK